METRTITQAESTKLATLVYTSEVNSVGHGYALGQFAKCLNVAGISYRAMAKGAGSQLGSIIGPLSGISDVADVPTFSVSHVHLSRAAKAFTWANDNVGDVPTEYADVQTFNDILYGREKSATKKSANWRRMLLKSVRLAVADSATVATIENELLVCLMAVNAAPGHSGDVADVA